MHSSSAELSSPNKPSAKEKRPPRRRRSVAASAAALWGGFSGTGSDYCACGSTRYHFCSTSPCPSCLSSSSATAPSLWLSPSPMLPRSPSRPSPASRSGRRCDPWRPRSVWRSSSPASRFAFRPQLGFHLDVRFFVLDILQVLGVKWDALGSCFCDPFGCCHGLGLGIRVYIETAELVVRFILYSKDVTNVVLKILNFKCGAHRCRCHGLSLCISPPLRISS